MVFCYQNCSDPTVRKNCSSDREKVFEITKGQIISKGLFGILGFFLKTNEQIRF